jgi:hypothetical protein
MSPSAPLHVPVEILRRDGRARWFRLTTGVSPESLRFANVVPEELDGPLLIAFHLPGDAVAVRCSGRTVEEVVGEGEDEHAERRVIELSDLDDAARTRLHHYVTERLGLS